MTSPPKEKERLTEQQKKENHIQSEQKRRQAIRDQYDRLAAMVPGMDGMGRSEAVVLQGVIDEIAKQIEIYKQNIAEMERLGIPHDDLIIRDLEPPAASNGVGTTSK